MNDGDYGENGTDERDVVGEIIRAAGKRVTPSAAAMAEARAAVTATWERKTRRTRNQRQWLQWGAVAATLVVAVGIWVQFPRTGIGSVATTYKVIGELSIVAADNKPAATRLGDDDAINTGSTLQTGTASFAGLRLGDGSSLRVDEQTRIVLAAAGVIELLSGRIYVDTYGRVEGSPGVEIRTGGGVFRDIGTQFEVRQTQGTLRLRVRDGSVTFASTTVSALSNAGEEVVVDGTGAVSRSRFSPSDPGWDWTLQVAPLPRMTNIALDQLLAWVTRESGRDVRFASAVVEGRASRTRLHGRVDRLSPLEALDVMLATTDLSYELLEDGSILIRDISGAAAERNSENPDE